jgi:zinc transport system ATP-binding protein
VETNTVITASNITKTVTERDILRDVSFALHAQELVALIGPNGAGKTSLVKILLGLDTEFSGSVTIAKSERIQYIPQLRPHDQSALPISVKEYLRIGLTPLYRQSSKPADDLEKALQHVGIEKTVLKQSFNSLSGGEQQRIAIARALLSDPTILVLDEPLASVDYHSRGPLYELLRHLQQIHHITMLLVSHDIDSVLPISDTVLCLNQTLHNGCHPADFANQTGLATRTVHHHN